MNMNKNGKSTNKIINNYGNGCIQIIYKKKLYCLAVLVVAITEVVMGGSLVLLEVMITYPLS